MKKNRHCMFIMISLESVTLPRKIFIKQYLTAIHSFFHFVVFKATDTKQGNILTG